MEMDTLRQAILILWHRNEGSLRRLISHFDSGFDIYVHVDRKTEIPAWLRRLSVEDRRVHAISKVRVNWGGLSIVRAELALIREALDGGTYSYLHIVSGEDVAIASPDGFRRRLSGSHAQYMEHFPLPTPKWNGGGLDRLRYYWPMDARIISRHLTHRRLQSLTGLQRSLGICRRIPDEFGRLHGGSNWVSLTADCARWLVTDPMPRRLLRRLRHTFAPDEIFFQTAVLNSPYADSVVSDSLRYIDWGKGRASPESLTALHAAAALRSGALFARKAVEGVSEGFIVELECLSGAQIPAEATDIYMIEAYEEGYNGVDTYRTLVEEIFSDRDLFTLTELVFSAPRTDVTVERGIRKVLIDLPPKEGIAYLAGLGIVDTTRRNLFMQNFCPASPTVCAVRRDFPESVILYVVHDFMWMAMFNGNVGAYMDFIKEGRLPAHLSRMSGFLQALFQDTRNAAGASDAVLCHNADTEELLHGFFGISREHIRMIPMGLSPSRNATRYPRSGKTFLFAGRPTPQKGFDTLVEAALKLWKYDPEARIIVAGNPMLYRGTRPGNMIFTCQLSRKSLLSLMGEADFGVIPSRYEQFGLVGLEMMRAGLPVIASDSFGVRRMFSRDNAMVFHKGDSDGLFMRMKEALAMTAKERMKMSDAGLRDFRRRFGFAAMKERYLTLVNGLFGNVTETGIKKN